MHKYHKRICKERKFKLILKTVGLNSLSLKSSLSLKFTAIAAIFSPSALPSVGLRGYYLFDVKNKPTKTVMLFFSFYFGSCSEAKREPSHPLFTKSGGEKKTNNQPIVKKVKESQKPSISTVLEKEGLTFGPNIML